MKKNTLTIIVIIVLSAIAGYLYLTNNSGTIKKELKDFAVKDTANVTKIFMADPFGKTVTVERRNEGGWMVNGKHEVRRDAIDLILSTISRMEVKSPVSKASFENVVTNLAGHSTKVEIYKGKNKPAKVFYVGGSTKDQFGTYMLLENSSVPFIMHIPGFYGYLSSRFFVDETEWKTTKLYRYSPRDIEKIEVNYVEYPQESFVIENLASGKPSLRSAIMDREYNDFDTLSVLQYAASFRNVNFEFHASEVPETTRDSVLTHCKLFSIDITDIHGNKNSFTAYNKPMPEGSEDLEGNPIVFDVDRMFGMTNDGDFVIIQHFVFDPLTPKLRYFLKSEK